MDAQRSQRKSAIEYLPSVVRLADQVTSKNMSELVTSIIGFVDDKRREAKAGVEALCVGDGEQGLYSGSTGHTTQLS